MGAVPEHRQFSVLGQSCRTTMRPSRQGDCSRLRSGRAMALWSIDVLQPFPSPASLELYPYSHSLQLRHRITDWRLRVPVVVRCHTAPRVPVLKRSSGCARPKIRLTFVFAVLHDDLRRCGYKAAPAVATTTRGSSAVKGTSGI